MILKKNNNRNYPRFIEACVICVFLELLGLLVGLIDSSWMLLGDAYINRKTKISRALVLCVLFLTLVQPFGLHRGWWEICWRGGCGGGMWSRRAVGVGLMWMRTGRGTNSVAGWAIAGSGRIVTMRKRPVLAVLPIVPVGIHSLEVRKQRRIIGTPPPQNRQLNGGVLKSLGCVILTTSFSSKLGQGFGCACPRS